MRAVVVSDHLGRRLLRVEQALRHSLLAWQARDILGDLLVRIFAEDAIDVTLILVLHVELGVLEALHLASRSKPLTMIAATMLRFIAGSYG